MSGLKERHGCVTFWLWLIIFFFFGAVIFGIVQMFEVSMPSFVWGMGLSTILAVVNILGSVLLMRWNKLGFYLFLIGSLCGTAINMLILAMTPMVIFSSLLGILVWWAVLQIKKGGVSAWNQMFCGWDYKHCRHLYQVFIGIFLVLLVITSIRSLTISGNVKEQKEELVASDLIEDSAIAEEEIISHASEIEWKEVKDDLGACSVEVPSDFRKTKFNDDQLVALLCTNFDPVVVVVRETAASLQGYGVTTSKEYAQIILKMLQNVDGSSNFCLLSEGALGIGAYLVRCNVTLDDDVFYYNILAVKSGDYYYYCQVFCLDAYKEKLEGQMEHILNSFKVLD